MLPSVNGVGWTLERSRQLTPVATPYHLHLVCQDMICYTRGFDQPHSSCLALLSLRTYRVESVAWLKKEDKPDFRGSPCG